MMGPRPVTASSTTSCARRRVGDGAAARASPGRTAAFHVGPVTLRLHRADHGRGDRRAPGVARDLEVRVSPFLLPRLAAQRRGRVPRGRDAGRRGVRARNLVPRAASHLGRRGGSLDASSATPPRIARSTPPGAGALGRRCRRSARAQAAAEYWTEERPLIASRVKVEDFNRDVSELARRRRAPRRSASRDRASRIVRPSARLEDACLLRCACGQRPARSRRRRSPAPSRRAAPRTPTRRATARGDGESTERDRAPPAARGDERGRAQHRLGSARGSQGDLREARHVARADGAAKCARPRSARSCAT